MYPHLYGQHVSPNFYLFSLRQMQISSIDFHVSTLDSYNSFSKWA